MMLFVLGTIPISFFFCIFSSVANEKTTRSIAIIGGVMVSVLGLCMFTQGIGFFSR